MSPLKIESFFYLLSLSGVLGFAQAVSNSSSLVSVFSVSVLFTVSTSVSECSVSVFSVEAYPPCQGAWLRRSCKEGLRRGWFYPRQRGRECQRRYSSYFPLLFFLNFVYKFNQVTLSGKILKMLGAKADRRRIFRHNGCTDMR